MYTSNALNWRFGLLELMPFSAIAEADVRRRGERDRESLLSAQPRRSDRRRHALYRVEFHVGDEPRRP
jgi:hypothetical protein